MRSAFMGAAGSLGAGIAGGAFGDGQGGGATGGGGSGDVPPGFQNVQADTGGTFTNQAYIQDPLPSYGRRDINIDFNPENVALPAGYGNFGTGRQNRVLRRAYRREGYFG